MAEVSSIERTILDFRYFIDESLTFLEHFESGERDSMRKFTTTQQEIAKIRHNSIEFIRLLYDLKNTLFSSQTISDFNLSLEFSKEFRQKRVFFFKTINSRLDTLYKRIFTKTANHNDLVRIYYETTLKIARNTNEFIGFLESSRWNRDIAVKFIDSLVKLSNDFACVFEKFALHLENNQRIVSNEQRNEINREKIPFRLNNLRAKATKSIHSFLSSLSSQSFSRKSKSSCPIIIVVMICLIGIVLFLIALPFIRLVFGIFGGGESSSIVNKRTNYFWFHSGSNSNGNMPIISKEDSLIDWTFILSYLSNLYVIAFTFVAFVIIECVMKF
jgi:hypothetical protein